MREEVAAEAGDPADAPAGGAALRAVLLSCFALSDGSLLHDSHADWIITLFCFDGTATFYRVGLALRRFRVDRVLTG